MQKSMFDVKGQKGFTLLELLIVVTIIAILSVGALLAYEGLTEKAQSASAANNTAGADQAIRNYRAVTGNYPNQWDHLIAQDQAAEDLPFIADVTYQKLAKVDVGALSSEIIETLDAVGIEELQVRTVTTTTAGVEPNLQHSEGASSGDAEDLELEDGEFVDQLVVVPTAFDSEGTVTLCQINGATPTAARAGIDSTIDDSAAAVQNFMITVNDNIGEDECHAVVAFGFGHDAAHSTVNSNVAIAAAPAFVGDDIKPADNYARYIALFDIGVDANGDGDVNTGEFHSKAKLIGLIDPEGKVIDQNVAAANDDTVN